MNTQPNTQTAKTDKNTGPKMAENNNSDKKPQRNNGLKPKQKRFAEYYIIDYNPAKAYKKAYGDNLSEKVCRVNASRLLAKNSLLQDYIKEISGDLEKVAGISKLRIILEHAKIAFSSIADLHSTWIDRKSFDSLTDAQRACIAEIDSKIKKEYEYNPETEQKDKPVMVEYVRIKLFDKQRSLDALCRIMGYDKDILERLDEDSLNSLAEILMKKRNEITQRNN